jgi:hypothetical protein
MAPIKTLPPKKGGPAARSIENVNRAARPLAPRPPRDTTTPVRVRALKVVYYDDKLRRPGDVFSISGRTNKHGELAEFSHVAMERCDPHEPEKITGSQEALDREHEDIRAGRAAARQQDNPDPEARMIPGDRRPAATIPGANRPSAVATGHGDPLGADD